MLIMISCLTVIVTCWLTKSLDEIMADKLISLVNTTRYVRHRDIWDLRWLKQRGSSINKQFILSKINDYKISDYPAKLKIILANIEKIIFSEAFKNELSRFIPLDVQERTLKKDKFKDFLINETRLLLSETLALFDGKPKQEEFYM